MNLENPIIVQAIYSFKGQNNDELCFKKGDKITLTQKIDGGWWEGTLNEKTGWFPSNYVKELKDVQSPISPISQKRQYYSIVLHDLTESEKSFVTELQGLISNFLHPLEKSSILNADEFRQLTGNINEILDVHKTLLKLLEENESKSFVEQKVGKIFLTWASKLKSIHQTYCSLHPKAACILDKFKDNLGTFMESCGANQPGILILTTGLSKPFRRLDKYSGILQELERHIDENHHDRGDTQRSVAVYNDISSICASTRRQKELELQVLTGPVRGWEGPSLAQLGDIIHMGSVAVGPQHHDRYLVLFSNNLLILSVSQRMSAFIYEGKLPLTGIKVKRIEDNDLYKNAFEISGPFIETIIAICQTKSEAQFWVEVLQSHVSSETLISSRTISDSQLNNRPSILNYRTNILEKKTIIFPPENYPPTSPYYSLTKFFKKLLKNGLMTSEKLKFLLYNEYTSINQNVINSVQKRIHRNTAVFYIRQKSSNDSMNSDLITDCDDNSSSESDEELFITTSGSRALFTRQNAIDLYVDSSDTAIKLKKVQLHIFNNEHECCNDTLSSNFQYVPKQYKAYENLANMGTSSETENSTDFIPKSYQSLPTKLKNIKENFDYKLSYSSPKMHLSTLDINPNVISLPNFDFSNTSDNFIPKSYRDSFDHYTNTNHSPRSSDSGMAGSSYTIRSPNLIRPSISEKNYNRKSIYDPEFNFEEQVNSTSLSEIEANQFEAECPCTSPFGSSLNLSNQVSLTDSTSNNNNNESLECISVSSNTSENSNQSVMYKSELYCHWWQKIQIPNSAIMDSKPEPNTELSKTTRN